MVKYLLGFITIAFFGISNLNAAPLHSYYCFSTTQPQEVVASMDSWLTSEAAKGLPTVRLWSMALNGELPETHCVVFENANEDGFESMLQIFSSTEGQEFLSNFEEITVDGLEGAGTPIKSYGDTDFSKNRALMLFNVSVRNPKVYIKQWSELMESSNINGSATLFEDTFTGVEKRTHYVGISGPSLAEVRAYLAETLKSEAGREFLRKSAKVRKLISVNLMYHIKSWN